MYKLLFLYFFRKKYSMYKIIFWKNDIKKYSKFNVEIKRVGFISKINKIIDDDVFMIKRFVKINIGIINFEIITPSSAMNAYTYNKNNKTIKHIVGG